MQALGSMMQDSYGEGLAAGEYVQSLTVDRLVRGGFHVDHSLTAWPKYRKSIDELQPVRQPYLQVTNQQIDRLAQKYSDVSRASMTTSGDYETNARHVMHLNAVSLPYAAEFHPDLDRSRLAIYNLIHDVVEAYSGDTPSLGIDAKTQLDKQQRERVALERIIKELGKTHSKLIALMIKREYLEDDEAAFSKLFDKIGPKLTTISNQGMDLHKGVISMSKQRYDDINTHSAQTMRTSYGKFYPLAVDDFQELSIRSSEAAWPANKSSK